MHGAANGLPSLLHHKTSRRRTVIDVVQGEPGHEELLASI